ncbi:MAG TPA: EamA family transporter [Candidatus Nanopelagicales bacterium]
MSPPEGQPTGGRPTEESEARSAITEIGAASGLNVVAQAPRRRSRFLGYALYLPAAFFFSLNGTVSKQLLVGGVDPLRLSQLRVTAAFVVLFVVVLVTRPRSLRMSRSELPLILMYGVAGVAMTQWLYFVAIDRLPVGVALLIEFTAPIMVALWVRFAWHQPVRDRVWGALALSMLGLAMVGQVWDGFSLNGIGVAAGLGAAAALAIYYLTGERAVANRDPVSLTMWGFGAASLLWAVVAPWWSFPWEQVGAVQGSIGPLTSIPGWWLVAYMVLLGTVVPFALVLFSLQYLSASQASVVGMAEPLMASAIAWVVLGEVLTPVQIVGGVVVLAGVLIAENSR